jgi:fatty acid CoA ligase FadD9
MLLLPHLQGCLTPPSPPPSPRPQFWRSGFNLRINRIRLPGIGLAFMPFNHIMGRVAVYQTLAKGGLVSFVRRSDMSTLLEDMGAVRPCSLTLVPRVGQLLYDAYTERRAVRLAALGPDATPEAVGALEAELLGWVRRDLLGGRLRFIITASAPTPPAVMAFLREAAACPVLNGYGSTELGGITVDGRLTMDVVEAKLEDVPELGYSVHDHPYPRGELCVKSRSCIKGYFKNPEVR